MNNNALASAIHLIQLGMAPIPIPLRGKNPGAILGKDWISTRITEATAPKHFGGKPRNVGVILGTPSGELVDLDLDCQSAIDLAPHLLPPTATFGRPSKLTSHWIYRADEAGRIKQFQDPAGGMIVEYRANGGQTVFPGSVHESGEPITWTNKDSPITELPADKIRLAVGRLAVAVLLSRAGLSTTSAINIATSSKPNLAKFLQGPSLARAASWLGLNINNEPTQQSPSSDTGDAFERARSYLRHCPDSISGQGGHNQTLWVAICLKRGFLLSDPDTLSLLREYNSAQCKPPWSDREIDHKLKSATNADRLSHPDGWLLNANRPNWRTPPPPQDDEPDPELPPWIDPDTGELIDTPTKSEKPPDDIGEGLPLPEGYEVRKTGLVKVVRKKSSTKTCKDCHTVCKLDASKCPNGHQLPDDPDVNETAHQIAHVPLWIGAELNRREGNLWRIDAQFGKKIRRVVIERALKHDPRKLAMAIEAPGIPVAASKNGASMLAEYLDRFDVTNRKRIPKKMARSQFGWDEKCRSFLLGRDCIGNNQIALHASNVTVDKIADWLVPTGKQDLWEETAQQIIESSLVAALVLSASVASPMLKPFNWAPIGIGLSSLGGGNKSTLLRFGASVWGYHGDSASRQASGLVGNGNATALAMVGQFSGLADLPHFVDELRANVTEARGRHELEAALHQLIDGCERARMKRDGTGVRSGSPSVGCAVLATETHVDEFLVKGGAVRRFMPAPTPYATRPLGGVVTALCESNGHPGRQLAQALVGANSDERGAMASRKVEHLKHLRTDTDPDNETLRTWSDQIAVALAAADAACKLCPETFPDHELWTNQIVACWNSLKTTAISEKSNGGDIPARAYELTVDWIAAMRDHLRPSPGRNRILARADDLRRGTMLREPIIGRVFKATNEGEEDETIEVVDVFSRVLTEYLASKGHSLGTLSTDWNKRGWIESRPDGNTVTAKVGGSPVRCYRLKLPVLEVT